LSLVFPRTEENILVGVSCLKNKQSSSISLTVVSLLVGYCANTLLPSTRDSAPPRLKQRVEDMGVNATCLVGPSVHLPMLQGEAFTDTGCVDTFSCLAVPSFLESSSPSSDSSTSSSSSSELFNATELTNEASTLF
ncbi:hypothetical protein GOP47_0026750, partial [Adiantum capillus-veneris]